MERIIGKRVQELRRKKGITQERLSEMIGITPHYLSALERGIYNIKLELLVKIMNSLGCSADDVFCGVVEASGAARSNELYERLEGLPLGERNRIYDVVDTMIKGAGK